MNTTVVAKPTKDYQNSDPFNIKDEMLINLKNLDHMLDSISIFAESKLYKTSNELTFNEVYILLKKADETDKIVERVKYSFKMLLALYFDDLTKLTEKQHKRTKKLKKSSKNAEKFLWQLSDIKEEVETAYSDVSDMH